MRIRFEWRGNTDTEDGIAIYRTETNTLEIHQPSLRIALQVQQMLDDVLTEGRRMGHREIHQGINKTITEIVRNS